MDGLVLAAERDGVCGSTFTIVDTVNTLTQNDYIEACQEIAVSKIRVLRVPPAVLMAAAVAANLVSRVTKIALPLSPYRLRSSLPLQNFDCRAAQQGLGWTPRIGTASGLKPLPISDAKLSRTPAGAV